MNIPQDITLKDAKNLLSSLKEYADITKKLGKRGRKIFSHKIYNTHEYVVEYYPTVGENFAWESAKRIYEKALGEIPQKQEVCFIPLETIKGGIKVYKDDIMCDMSFDTVEKRIQK